MTNARPGWYPDWERTDHVRWWDGRAWTTFVAPVPAVPPPPAPTPSSGPVAPRRSARTWIWAAVGVAAILLSLLFPPLMIIVATTTLITAIVALAKRRPTWLRLRSRGVAATVTAISAAVLLVAGSVSAATLPTSPADDSTKAVPFAAPVATDAAVTTPSPTPTPTPTPVTTTTSVTVTQPIPFKSRTVSDPTLAKGTSRLKTAGVQGLRTLTYSVTLVDGKEVSRVLASNVVTHQPVAQVTAVGTYVAPLPPRQAAPRCDPNYAGGCVPVASDVDCAGGSGNGPAYFSGTARVVGRDIYDLDRDGDGIACDR